VVGGDRGDVGHLPPGARQVPRQQLLLTADAEALREAADLEHGRAAHDDRAGDEREKWMSRLPVDGRQARPRHRLADRVDVPVRADEDVPVDGRQAGVAVQQVGGAAERAGLPPRVVVAERHVRGVDLLNPRVARRAADVAGEPDDLDAQGRGSVGGAVRRRVVDQHRPRALRQRQVLGQRPEQELAAVARGDDQRHTRVCAAHDSTVAVPALSSVAKFGPAVVRAG
jgi:hypothetical protein